MKSKARSSEANRSITLTEEADALLHQLTPHEERIVRLRFGIGARKHEVADVAARLSLTPTAVHRIEQYALRKLRMAAMTEERSECAEAG